MATTGNTGAAAANGLKGMDGIDVFVLYPKGHLSRMQRAAFGASGGNVHPVEVMGSVEDCKRLIQEAFADKSLSELRITGANSINVARLLPQVVFSCHAYAGLLRLGVENAGKAVYSLPCGNLSNLVAAVMARRSGLPAGRLIAATNINNGVGRLLQGEMKPSEPVKPTSTFAPGIDMSYPSGWPRLNKLYEGDTAAMQADIFAASPVEDSEIAACVRRLREDYGYTIDPHGAVAYCAAEAYEAEAGVPKVVFATGHPAKQLDIMTRITGSAIELPVQLTRFMHGSRHHAMIPPTLPALKKQLLMHCKTF